MKVELITHMGSDLTVVNAARVSFDKQHDKLMNSDYNLIKYLAKHRHWTPFAHCFLQFRITAPIFVARQLGKHQIGLTWNEVSRRYVNHDPEFWDAETGWREATEDKKQGSGKLSHFQPDMYRSLDIVNKTCLSHYRQALDMGICEEQARALLPQSMMTMWWWSGSLYAFARVCQQRMTDDAQQETKQIAQAIDNHCKTLYPISWNELTGYDIGEG